MKLFIAYGCYPYEGPTVIGVYSSRSLSEKAISDYKIALEKDVQSDEWEFIQFTVFAIKEIELDKSIFSLDYKEFPMEYV